MFVFVSFFCLWCISFVFFYSLFFFFNDTATTEIYTSDTLFPYTTLFRSPLRQQRDHRPAHAAVPAARGARRGADPVGGLRARCHRGEPEHRSDRGAPRRQRNPRRPAQRRLRVQRGRRRRTGRNRRADERGVGKEGGGRGASGGGPWRG